MPFNIASLLEANARQFPTRLAVICDHSADSLGRTQLTFNELDDESSLLARGLLAAGLKPGMRTLLMVRPGLDFLSLTFALFKVGAVPVLIDPGMGTLSLLQCIQQARPEAMIALPLAHAVR